MLDFWGVYFVKDVETRERERERELKKHLGFFGLHVIPRSWTDMPSDRSLAWKFLNPGFPS